MLADSFSLCSSQLAGQVRGQQGYRFVVAQLALAFGRDVFLFESKAGAVEQRLGDAVPIADSELRSVGSAPSHDRIVPLGRADNFWGPAGGRGARRGPSRPRNAFSC